MTKFDVNLLNDEIFNFISLVDDYFNPKLSSRIDLYAYASKLYTNAKIVCAKDKNEILIGLCAFYINHKNNTSYLSFIAIDKNYHGRNIGSELINKMEQILRELQIQEVRLEVYSNNTQAKNFYYYKGYHEINKNNDSTILIKYI